MFCVSVDPVNSVTMPLLSTTTPAAAGLITAIENKNVRMLRYLMHPLLWEYMKHSQQSNYNRNSLNRYLNRIPTKMDTVVRDASYFSHGGA